MRIKSIFMLLGMAAFPFLSIGQTFQKEYTNADFSRYSMLMNLLERPDGTFIAPVYNYFYGIYNYTTGVACFQSDGTPLWITGDEKKYLFQYDQVTVLPDNSYITQGSWRTSVTEYYRSILSHYDADGTILWSRTMDSGNQTIAESALSGVTGKKSIFLFGGYLTDLYAARINADGSAIWEKTILQSSSRATNAAELENGNLLLCFNPDYQTKHIQHLIEISPEGTFIQEMTYEMGDLRKIVGLKNGNILIAYQSDWDFDTKNTSIAMLDAHLKPIWANKIEIPGWKINDAIIVPNLQQDSISILFNNSPGAELGFLTLDLNGKIGSAKARFGAWMNNALRASDDGLFMAGGKPVDNFLYGVFVKTDAAYNVKGCPAVPLCNVAYTPEHLQYAPASSVLTDVQKLEPFELSSQKSNWQSSDFCEGPPLIDASFTMDASKICTGTSASFFAVSSGNGVWQFDGGLPFYQNSGWIGKSHFDTPGQYQITHITTQAGCYKDTATQTIQVFPSPKLELPAENTLCAGDSILVTPGITEPGIQYKWSDGLTTPQRVLSQAGTYILEALSPEACKSTDTTILYTVLLPKVQIEGQTEACIGETVVLQAATDRSGLKIEWNTGLENAELDVQTSGLYSVQVHDGPCTVEDTMRVFFKECPTCTLFIPTVFAPGSGGANDRWAVQSNCVFSQYHVQLYDRWGNLVFQSAEPNSSWDGMYKGKILPPGVYVCRIDLETDNGDKRTRMQRLADVTIVR